MQDSMDGLIEDTVLHSKKLCNGRRRDHIAR
jgi:hypothetical protein